MKKIAQKFDCIYTNGCSWTYGSELVDPLHKNEIADHFAHQHDRYRQAHHWPELLAQSWGVSKYDGSEAGSSNDRIYRTTVRDVIDLVRQGRKPFVVIAWTQLHRFELPEAQPSKNYRQFVSPIGELPLVAKEIWEKWNTDRADVERWLGQLIGLDSLFRTLAVDHMSTTVFNFTYPQYERETEDPYFENHLYYLRNTMNLSNHLLHYCLETYLKQQSGVTYGVGGHPLEIGHKLIADYIRRHMLNTFQFQR